MEELVGICHQCGKNLYCLDGFFNGVKTEDQKTLCFDCAEEEVTLVFRKKKPQKDDSF